jgi:GT2 family glycosyltransferase
MLHTWDHDSSRPVPWVIGAALALRVQPVRQVGGFDAGYFLYCEEIDLCMRLWGAGWEVHFTPTANVTHVGGSSTTGDRSSTDQHMVTSTLRFYRIHYGSLRGWFLRMLLHAKLALTGKRAVRTLIGRPPGCAPHPWTRQ